MKIAYTARGVELTNALKTRLEKRLGKLETMIGEINQAHAVFAVQKNRQSVELILKIGRNKYVSQGESGDMYASIEAACDGLSQQFKKVKETARDRHRHAASRRRPSASAEALAVAVETDDAAPPVTRQPQPVLKPMTLKMATLMLATRKEPVLLYTSADSGRLAVLYRRDGGYGLIES
jgi:putative sigma-54 modulation protein